VKNFISSLLSLFLISCCLSINHYSNSEYYKPHVYNSVARIAVAVEGTDDYVLFATGFAVTKDLILTAGHFCRNYANGMDNELLNDSASYIFYNGKEFIESYGLELVDYEMDDENDLDTCLMRKQDHGLTILNIFNEKHGKLEVGDKIFVVGAPYATVPSIRTDGYIAAMNDETILVSSPGGPGNSGSPVFNENLEVIGMLVRVNTRYSFIVTIISYKQLNDFLNSF